VDAPAELDRFVEDTLRFVQNFVSIHSEGL